MKRRNLFVVVVALLLAGGIFWWLLTHVEIHKRQINTGPRLDAQINPWFAAKAFMQQQDQETHHAIDLHIALQHLQPDDTLVLLNDGPIQDISLQKKLIQWMRQGGHLIMAATLEWDEEEESSEDDFLDAMGVRMLPLENTANEDDTQDDDNSCSLQQEDGLFLVKYADNADPLQIQFNDNYTLEDAQGSQIRDSGNSPNGMLQYPTGKGRLTVLLSTEIWTNKNIGDFDHAFLLWHLTKPTNRLWFVTHQGTEKLPALLWRTAPYLIVSLVALLLWWAWLCAARFGPMLSDPVPERRQRLEHIKASALFDWKHQQIDSLLQQLRDDIHSHCPHDKTEAQDRLRYLAEHSGLSENSIQHAMSCPVPRQEAGWAVLISQLQHIRNSL